MIDLCRGENKDECNDECIYIDKPIDTAGGGVHNIDSIENDKKDNGERKREGPLEQMLNNCMITKSILKEEATIKDGTKSKREVQC